MILNIIFKDFISLLLETGGGREKNTSVRKKHRLAASHTPNQGQIHHPGILYTLCPLLLLVNILHSGGTFVIINQHILIHY